MRPDNKKKLLLRLIQRRIARGITYVYTENRSRFMASADVQDALKQYVETLLKLRKRSCSKGTSVPTEKVEKVIQDETQAQDLLQDCRFLQRADESECPSAHLLLAFSLELIRSPKLRDRVEIHLQQCRKCELYTEGLKSPVQRSMTNDILNALKGKNNRVIDAIEKHFRKP